MNPDAVNGAINIIGACLVAINVRKLHKERRVLGVHYASTLFFTLWGAWNLYFYPSLGQWYSFAGGLTVFLANASWLILFIRYRK